VGRYILQMENDVCNVTFYNMLSASYRYLYLSYNILFPKGAASMLVTFPSILCKNSLPKLDNFTCNMVSQQVKLGPVTVLTIRAR
jgi:hypothetical protein